MNARGKADRKGKKMVHKLIFATHNENKLKEVRDLLKDTDLTVVSAGELNLPDVEETGETFKDNALLKAYAAYRATGLPALAEDSGLCIRALNGAPGVYSARFAQKHGGYPKVFDYITAQMGDNPDRSIYYQATMALIFDETDVQVFDGVLEGTWADAPKGTGGFGYDPMFIPKGYDKTLAELGKDVKNGISHRGQALKKVFDYLKNRR